MDTRATGGDALETVIAATNLDVAAEDAEKCQVHAPMHRRWHKKTDGTEPADAQKPHPSSLSVDKGFGGFFKHLQHKPGADGLHAYESHWTSNRFGCGGTCGASHHTAPPDAIGKGMHVKGMNLDVTIHRMGTTPEKTMSTPQHYGIGVRHKDGTLELHSVKVESDGTQKTKIYVDKDNVKSTGNHVTQLRNAARIVNKGSKMARAEEAAEAGAVAAEEGVVGATVFGVDIAAAPIIITAILACAVMWEIWNMVDHDRAQKFKGEFLAFFHSAGAKMFPFHPHHEKATKVEATNLLAGEKKHHVHLWSRSGSKKTPYSMPEPANMTQTAPTATAAA